MKESPPEMKKIVKDYVLITYDIPASNGKLRKRVLKKMAEIGAIPHTQSVYLLPFSDTALALAGEIEEAGNAVVWVSEQKDEGVAKGITFKYEEHLKVRIQSIELRFHIIKEHIEGGRLGKANRMAAKTSALIQQLLVISKHHNPPWFLPKVDALVDKMKEVYEG